MDNNTTTNQRRRPARKAEDFHLAWKELAPEQNFGGKSVADLEAAIGLLEDAAGVLKLQEVKRSAAVKVRNEQESALGVILLAVAHGVRGDPAYGEDSPLYRAMGFVPKSERNSGLTRRGSAPPGNGETAA